MPNLVIIGGRDSRDTIDAASLFDPLSTLRQRAQPPQPLLGPREAHAAVSIEIAGDAGGDFGGDVGGEFAAAPPSSLLVVVAGGHDGRRYLPSTEALDGTGRWRELPPLAQPRAFHSTSVVQVGRREHAGADRRPS